MPQGLLPQPPALPRELAEPEVAALLRAADDDARLVMLLLLSGLDEHEVTDLRWDDIDLGGKVMHVEGASPRDIPLSEPLRRLLAARASTGDDLVVRINGRPATLQDLSTQTLCAGHDAGLEHAAQVTPSALRHTYIAFLVRQGVRFADLTRRVGHLSGELLGAYAAYTAPGSRLPVGEIDGVHPAVQELGEGGVRATG